MSELLSDRLRDEIARLKAENEALRKALMAKDELPLRCEAIDGALNMSVGFSVLKFAAENHPELWNNDGSLHKLRITDQRVFAKEVARALNREAEDGSTPLILLLDKAILEALKQGCEGIDYEHMEKLDDADAALARRTDGQ